MKTFRIGGVHPAENKLSAGKAIETLALPKQAVFSLLQDIGEVQQGELAFPIGAVLECFFFFLFGENLVFCFHL